MVHGALVAIASMKVFFSLLVVGVLNFNLQHQTSTKNTSLLPIPTTTYHHHQQRSTILLMVGSARKKTLLQLLAFMLNHMTIKAQQSAACQDTLIALVGRDYVMMGADSSSSGGGGIALTSSNIDKLAVIHDGMSNGSISRFDAALRQQSIVVGFAGDAADGTKILYALHHESS